VQAYDRILAATDGQEALLALSGMDAAVRPELHMWRAPPGRGGEDGGGSSASMDGEGGVEWIKRLGGKGGCSWISDTVFEGAGHSVHNTRQEAFVAALNALALRGEAAPKAV